MHLMLQVPCFLSITPLSPDIPHSSQSIHFHWFREARSWFENFSTIYTSSGSFLDILIEYLDVKHDGAYGRVSSFLSQTSLNPKLRLFRVQLRIMKSWSVIGVPHVLQNSRRSFSSNYLLSMKEVLSFVNRKTWDWNCLAGKESYSLSKIPQVTISLKISKNPF